MFRFGSAFGSSGTSEVGVEELEKALKENKENILLIDVRTPGEFEAARVEGSLLKPLQSLGSEINALSEHKDKEVYLICRTGSRSQMATNMLSQAGFQKAYNVSGGVMSWYNAGLPLVGNQMGS